MVMPAFDMEPSSTSVPPDGVVPHPSGEAVAAPASPEAAPPKTPSRGETAPAKPPPASLVSIAVKNKAAAASKAGDLTRLFELARRQPTAPAAPIQPLPAEPVPAAAAPADVESPAEPISIAPTAAEIPAVEAAPEPLPLESAPDLAPAEPAALVEPAIVSEAAFEAPQPSLETAWPLMLAPPVAAEAPDAVMLAPIEAAPEAEPPAPSAVAATDLMDVSLPIEQPIAAEAPPSFETPEPLTVAFASMEESAAPLEIPEPASEQIEPPAEPTPAAMAEVAAPPAPEPPRVVEPTLPPVALASIEPMPMPAPPALAPVEPLPAPMPAAPAALKFKDLADYWRSLRVGEEHPAAESIDRDLVTERWPGSLLIAYTPASQDPRGELRPGRVSRLGTACKETQSVVDAGSHSTEWMLEVARTALINDEPVEEQQRLATLTGVAGFRMVALPLGPPRGLANAVLCSLLPSPGAPRFGKRRT